MMKKVKKLMQNQSFKRLSTSLRGRDLLNAKYNSDAEILWVNISDQEYVQKYGENSLRTYKDLTDPDEVDDKKRRCCSKKKVIKKDDEYTIEEVEAMD